MAKQTSEPIEHIKIRRGRYWTWRYDCGDMSGEIFRIKADRKAELRGIFEFFIASIPFWIELGWMICREYLPDHRMEMEEWAFCAVLFFLGSVCIFVSLVCINHVVRAKHILKKYEAAHPKKRKRK